MKTKKIICILLCLVLLSSFVACAGSGQTIATLLGNPDVETAEFRIGYDDTIAMKALNDTQKQAVKDLFSQEISTSALEEDGILRPDEFAGRVFIDFPDINKRIVVTDTLIDVSGRLNTEINGRYQFKETFDVQSFENLFK